MVYFQVSRIGFNCGIDKEECANYPEGCIECIKAHFAKFGCDVTQNLKITVIDSEERRIEMFQDLIWQKFLDVLNIKHILLMTKDTGLPIIDYPISGAGVDVGFLTGFIQANITFSESGRTTYNGSNQNPNERFYELQYETFNILLKNGKIVRFCLVLDQTASENLKTMVAEFLREYERIYQDKLERFLNTGKLEFEDTLNYILDTFNIQLVFPMVLTHTILPDILDSINKNHIQKAIIDFAKEILVTKQCFFINNLINKVQAIVNIDANIILYEIYQLLLKKVIIPTDIEVAASEIKKFHEMKAMRLSNNELISPIIANNNAINELKIKAKSLTEEDAKKLMDNFIQKGNTAENALVYKEAQKEYEKALFLATGFDLHDDIGKISFMVLELDKKIKELDLEYPLNAAEKAERRKDYINAINYYRQGLILLKETDDVNSNESKIKKLEKKIQNLQKNL